MNRIALFALTSLGCSRASSDYSQGDVDASHVDASHVDAVPTNGAAVTELASKERQSVGDSGPGESTDAGSSVPLQWVGSWHMSYATYFTMLGVRSAEGPLSGRSLCVVIAQNGHFEAELGEFAFGPGFNPCGRRATCQLAGQMTPEGNQVRITYEKPSCSLRLPNSNVGKLAIVGKALSFRFERGGLFGVLDSFGMNPGPCPKTPVAYPDCQWSRRRSGSAATEGY